MNVYSVLLNFLFSILFYFIFIIFLAALGLRCCVPAFSSCGEQGLLFVASLVVEYGL